jgi:hypothetical protein
MSKTKTIKLYGPTTRMPKDDEDPQRGVTCYRVIQVTDSIEFDPDQLVDFDEVKALCEATDWKVTIVGVQR